MARSPKNDPQRERVYRMEHYELLGHSAHVLPEKVMRDVIRVHCERWEVPEPKFRIREDYPDAAGVYDRRAKSITLHPSLGRNAATLAHELAHHVVAVNDPAKALSWHGPEWLFVYLVMLDHMRIVPLRGMKLVAKHYGLRIKRLRKLFPESPKATRSRKPSKRQLVSA